MDRFLEGIGNERLEEKRQAKKGMSVVPVIQSICTIGLVATFMISGISSQENNCDLR